MQCHLTFSISALLPAELPQFQLLDQHRSHHHHVENESSEFVSSSLPILISQTSKTALARRRPSSSMATSINPSPQVPSPLLPALMSRRPSPRQSPYPSRSPINHIDQSIRIKQNGYVATSRELPCPPPSRTHPRSRICWRHRKSLSSLYPSIENWS
jgi:hypothetical protein